MFREFYLIATTLAVMAFLPITVSAEPAKAPYSTGFITEALLKEGFQRPSIETKTARAGDVVLNNLRASYEDRVYDINIAGPSEFFLSISLNRGKNFGEALKFKTAESLIQTIRDTETRERKRSSQKASEVEKSSNDDGSGPAPQGTEAKGSGAGSLAGLIAAGESGGSSAVGGSGNAEGGANQGGGAGTDKAARKFAGKFAGGGNPCFGSLGGGNGSSLSGAAEGGVAAVAAQAAEAAMATGVAERAALGQTGNLGDATGLDKGDQSKFFDGAAQGSLAEMLKSGDFARASATDRRNFISLLLLSAVQDDGAALPNSYTNIRTLYGRLQRQLRNENLPESTFKPALLRLIKNLSMDTKSFQSAAANSSTDQNLGFFITAPPPASDTFDPIVVLDPESPDPESASRSFFVAALILLANDHLNEWHKLRRQFAPNNSTAKDLEVLEAFEPSQEDMSQQTAQAIEFTNSLRRTFANNPYASITYAPQNLAESTNLPSEEIKKSVIKTASKIFPNIPAAFWCVSPHFQKKVGKQSIWLATSLNQLPPTLLTVAVSDEAFPLKAFPLSLDHVESWNQWVTQQPWPLTDAQQMANFAARFVRLNAPYEEPQWTFSKAALAPLTPASVQRLERGWRISKSGGVSKLSFFGRNLTQQTFVWDLDINAAGQIIALRRLPLE